MRSPSANGISGLSVRVPTKVRSNGAIELGKRKGPNEGNNTTKSILLGMGIAPDDRFRQGNRGMCDAVHIPFAATTLNNGIEIRALCKSIRYDVGTNARNNDGVHLGNGNVSDVGGPSMGKSRCIAIRVSIPHELAPETGRTLRRCETID